MKKFVYGLRLNNVRLRRHETIFVGFLDSVKNKYTKSCSGKYMISLKTALYLLITQKL